MNKNIIVIFFRFVFQLCDRTTRTPVNLANLPLSSFHVVDREEIPIDEACTEDEINGTSGWTCLPIWNPALPSGMRSDDRLLY